MKQARSQMRLSGLRWVASRQDYISYREILARTTQAGRPNESASSTNSRSEPACGSRGLEPKSMQGLRPRPARLAPDTLGSLAEVWAARAHAAAVP